MKSRPTIRDVAALAGVSRQTVSRVINNKSEITPETKARVLEAIKELNYRPSAAARSMAAGRTKILGCISPSMIDFTFANVIEYGQAEARRLGYSLLAGSAPTIPDLEVLLEEMLRHQVEGLLVINPCADDRCEFFQPLPGKGIPVIYIISAPPDDEKISLVQCDDVDGGYQATKHLTQLGHVSIATILGPDHERSTFDRLDGYHQALAEAGLEPNPEMRFHGDWSATSGYQAAQQLLISRQTFTAIFAHNDQMAVGAIRALREAGLAVPADVSVIGFDDIPLASYFDPPLTTLRQPMKSFGEEAARLLIEAIQAPNGEPTKLLLPARLIERSSCAPVRT